MKVIRAIKLMKSGKMVGEQSLGITIYKIKDNSVYYKTLNYPWIIHCDIVEFNKKFINEIFEEVVSNKEYGLGYSYKKINYRI
jgi:hypothetical protein